MMKRILTIALAMMLVLPLTFAAAETAWRVPSKSAADTIKPDGMFMADGTEIMDGFVIKPVEETEAIAKEVEYLRAGLEGLENGSMLALLPEECNKDAAGLLKGDAELDADGEAALKAQMDALIVYECTPVQAFNYKEAYGDVDARFIFLTPYVEEMKAVVALGFPRADTPAEGEDAFAWEILPAAADAEGRMVVSFTQEQVLELEKQPGLMLVLSDPLPEIAE